MRPGHSTMWNDVVDVGTRAFLISQSIKQQNLMFISTPHQKSEKQIKTKTS